MPVQMVRDNRTKARAEFAGMVGSVIAKAAHDCAADAKRVIKTEQQAVRVVSIGKLRWRVEVSIPDLEIREFGGANTPPRPFLIPSYLRAKQNILRDVRVVRSRRIVPHGTTEGINYRGR